MNKKLIILIFLVLNNTLISFGQTIGSPVSYDETLPSMNRQEKSDRKYTPWIAGLANYLLFSSGYFYVGEPVRGAIVLGSGIASMGVFVYGMTQTMSVDIETGEAPRGARVWMTTGAIATGLIYLWSIYDVVRIARLKNSAHQQNRLSLKLSPEVITLNPNSNPGYGLKLKISF
jgi:hypothetical protein